MDNEFFSQFGEDKWLVENNILPEKGFFLDIGAGDWKLLSNTYYLEQHGWDGLCVDADPRQLVGLIENRKNVLVGAVKGYSEAIEIISFFMNRACADISRIDKQADEKEIFIPSISILDVIQLCHKNNQSFNIDLLSIDVEGAEINILQTMFDWGYFPTIIIVEFMTSGVDNSEKVKELFKNQPYKLIHTTTANFIYRRTK